jgi:reactive intermediate/imine deaminase
MKREVIRTNQAPLAIGTYSQAIKINGMVFISGQIPLEPQTMTLIDGEIDEQIIQVFSNLKAIAFAAGGDLSAIVKFQKVNNNKKNEKYLSHNSCEKQD